MEFSHCPTNCSSQNRIGYVDSEDYSKTVNKLRSFFQSKGFYEVHGQSRLSILAACEDPETIATYNYAGEVWPLPQTGQMHLEEELLKHPEWPGCFVVTTSFRNEPNPVPGRHDKVFPMFEFETHGDMETLIVLERELLEYLGYGVRESFPRGIYEDVAEKYNVKELEHEHEERLERDYGPVFFLTDFPQYTSPFWNMKKDGNYSKKVDVILNGIETIGSAERSTNKEEMRKLFHAISEGRYANTLYAQFTHRRVEAEMDEFLSYDFFPRVGGGIGLTRLIRSLKLNGLLE